MGIVNRENDGRGQYRRNLAEALLVYMNDVRSEGGFANVVDFILGDTGLPYDW